MRILIVSSTYAPLANGQAIFTTNLAEQLAKVHPVAAVVPSDQGQTYHTKKNGVEVQFLWTIDLSILYPGALFTPFPEVMIDRVIRSFRPDVVHIQDHYPLCYYALRIARQHHVKVVGTNHFMPENIAPIVPWIARFKRSFNWMLWWWMLRLYNRLDIATAPSRTAVEVLKRQNIKAPIYPITCGVDLERFHPDATVNRTLWRRRYGLGDDKIVFLFVGRVDGEKRLDVLINAVHLLKRDDIQLVIAGTGANLSRLSELAERLDLGDKVRFTGYIPNEHLSSLLNSVDVFAMPSEAELLSIATLEAMATARPLLLANALALPELASQGENGYLFKPGDAQDAAHYMALLADHPEKWAVMGAASQKRAQLHSLEKMRSGYEGIYRKALGEGGSDQIP
jgi:1,2-diacylglycerol 3-alpha-glucosyltransferase